MRDLRSDGARRLALFLDVDGTLIDFAALPSEVIVPTELVEDLGSLDQALDGALALVSGRTIADLDALFQPLRLRASGVHGAEIRFDPEAPVQMSRSADILPPELWSSLCRTLDAFPGSFAENKGFSFAVHYRAAPTLGAPLAKALQDFVDSHAERELQVFNAHLAFEIKAGHFNKGVAIEAFLTRAPFKGRFPVFIGDDWTDEAGFAAVVRSGGRAYAVGQPRPNASEVFSDPGEVRSWLGKFASQAAPS